MGVWQDETPIRSDLFGAERLEHHARTLAEAQNVITGAERRTPRLDSRVKDNAEVLIGAYRACAQALQAGQTITPAAEWLLDNFHLVEEQLRQIRDDLPPGYYQQLPKLADGPFVGYPRVLGIAWAYVAHTDSLISGPVLGRFVRAYQQVQPLMIGELWAVAITLRIVLIENMRRLALQISEGQAQRQQANTIVKEVMAAEQTLGQSQLSVMKTAIGPFEIDPLPEIVAAQIAKRLRGFDPAQTPLFAWLEDRLRRQGTSTEAVVANAQMQLAASNVTMRNIVTSMRLVSDMDWADFFEEVSLVDAHLRNGPTFAEMDFATRNRYRTAIEVIARGSQHTEIDVAEAGLALAAQCDTVHSSEPGYWFIGAGRTALEAKLKFKPSLRLRMFRWVGRLGLPGYLATIAALSVVILGFGLALVGAEGAGIVALLVLAITGLPIAIDVGTAIVNLIVTRTVAPMALPGLDLAKGIPPDLRTLTAVPVLLGDTDELQERYCQNKLI
jgi:cyclic beta-1,2-glucan synthetase